MAAFLKNLRSLGTVRLAMLGGAAALLIGFFVYMTGQLTRPEMALLYSQLDLADSAQIVSELEGQNITYEMRNDGATIMVPREQVDRLRLSIAQEGLPKGASIGYEIFDQGDGLGTTSFVQNINRLRALEGELARTIGTIEGIHQARVHLVLPERELFSREEQTPTASVFLQLNGGGLGPEQVRAITHLVAAAVPKLQPSAISIVDDQGNLLANGPAEDGDSAALASADQMRASYERRLTQTVEDLVGRSVGAGKVRAQVAVEMDFDRVTRSAESFDPNSQVARSTQTVDEKGASRDGQDNANQPVSVGQNLPEANAGNSADSSTSSQNSRTEETTNFEINRVVENTTREPGTVRRLSIAVLVDGTYAPDASGNPVYTPRPADELAAIKTLVSSAAGFDASRGDTIEVVNLPFATVDEGEAAPAEQGLLGLDRSDLFRIAQLVVIGIVAGLVLLLVVRPLLRRAMGGQAAPDATMATLLAAQSAIPALPPAGSDLPALPGPDKAEEEMVNVAQVEGKVRASAMRKVAEIVDGNPETAANVIRQWVYQEG